MNNSPSVSRIPGLDLIKVLGLTLVIYYHIIWLYPPDIVTSSAPGNFLYIYLHTFLCCCVPLFFMASGALSLSRPVQLKKNSLRCLHLLLITFFWAVVCLVCILILQDSRVSLREFLAIVLDLRIGYIQHLWYLPNFLFLCLMVPVLYALKAGNPKIYGYFIGLIAVFTIGNPLLNDAEYVLRWLLGKQGYTGYRTFFWFTDYFRYHYWYIFVYFALGDYLLTHKEKFLQKKRWLVLAIFLSMAALLLVTVAISRVQGYVYNYVFNNYSSIFTVILSGCVFLLLVGLKPGPRLQKLAASLSQCSLGIYIIHWLVWGAFARLIPTVMENVAFGLPMTVVIGLISWGITALGMKIPFVKDLFTAAPDWVKRHCA